LTGDPVITRKRTGWCAPGFTCIPEIVAGDERPSAASRNKAWHSLKGASKRVTLWSACRNGSFRLSLDCPQLSEESMLYQRNREERRGEHHVREQEGTNNNGGEKAGVVIARKSLHQTIDHTKSLMEILFRIGSAEIGWDSEDKERAFGAR
jgi:hypothetical protein